MSDQDELNPAERELEAALKSLTPRAARLDPVAAAYSAGQLSARRWRVATAAMALVGIAAWLPPAGKYWTIRQEVGVPVVVAVSPEMRPVSEQSMVMLQKAMWEKGVDGLAPVQPAPTRVMHIDEINSTHKGKS